MICVDLASRNVAWTAKISDDVPKHGYDGARCTPTLDGDRLYAISSGGRIACLKTADGSEVWSRGFDEWGGRMMSGWGFSESPLVDGDKVLFTPGGGTAMIVACDKMTGAEIWTATSDLGGDQGKDGAGYSSIVKGSPAGVPQYVQLTGRGAIGVSEDGDYLWGYNRVANPTANIPTPIIDGDQVLVSSGYGDGGLALLAIEKSGDGLAARERYWKTNAELQNHHGGIVTRGKFAYFGNKHNKGFPTCIRIEDGEVMWGGRMRGPGNGSAAVTLVGDQLIFRYQDGVVAFIRATPDAYELLGQFTPDYQEGKSWSHPVVVDGVMYLREQDVLMAYDVGK